MQAFLQAVRNKSLQAFPRSRKLSPLWSWKTHGQITPRSFSTRFVSVHCASIVSRNSGQRIEPGVEGCLGSAIRRDRIVKRADCGIRPEDRADRQGSLSPGGTAQAGEGSGTLIALTYVLTLDDPLRFRRSRDAGCFAGLRPGRRNSGTSQPQLHISKEGDLYLKTMLVQGAHYILGPFGEDSDLRRWGLKLAERGGKNAKKRAVVAVARKLAVLLHKLWVSGEVYEPLRNEYAQLAPGEARSTKSADGRMATGAAWLRAKEPT